MAGKLEDVEFKKRNFVPGPGTHDPVVRNDIPSMKFGTGKRKDLVIDSIAPGPGNYEQNREKLKKTSPKFGFGTGEREGRENKRLNVPGPGNYTSKAYVGKDLPSYSMGGTNKFFPERKEQNYKPGPGVYSPNNSFTKK